MKAPQRGGAESESRPPALGVVADLTITLDGKSAHLSSSGTDMVLTAADPLAFWQSLSVSELPSSISSVNGPKALGQFADLLSGSGLSLRLVGPKGDLVRLGAGGTSKAVRLITGSDQIKLGAASAIYPLVRGRVGALIGALRPLVLFGSIAVIVAAVVGSRLRRRS